jgi:hypothetical protein
MPIFMSKFSYILLVLLIGSASYGQVFPSISTNTLTREEVQLPDALNGKKSIIFLALSKKAEEKLADWYEPVYMLFLDESGFNAMAYDCNIRLLVLISGAALPAAERIKAQIALNANESMSELLLIAEGNFNGFYEDLSLSKNGDAFVIVLSENGSVIFQAEADYSDRLLDKIGELVELQ